jgi:predicted MFS family arabinose efflux permease
LVLDCWREIVNPSKATALEEWKSGWSVVLASSIGFSFFSVMLAAVGLFMGPLGEEFGWSRTTLSAGTTIATLTTALLGPFFGILVDRFGTRRLALPGLLLTIGAISGFSQLTGAVWQWYAMWFAFGFVSVSIKSTAWTAATVGMFTRSRGLALGMVLAGTAVSQTIVPPLGNWLIENYGWRTAFVCLALGWGGFTFLVCWLFFHDVNDEARGSAAKPEIVATTAALPGLTRTQGLRDTALWRLAVSNFVIMLLTMGLSVHLFPILTEAGITRTSAAWLSSLTGIAGIVGKIATGVLLDRYRPNWVGGVTLGASAFAFALLVDDIRSPTLIIIAMIVNGYVFGTKTQITGYMTASYAGMKSFGFLYGIMSALMALASGLGPLLAGMSYDNLGGYEPFLIAGTVGCILSGLLIFSLPPVPNWEEAKDELLRSPEPLVGGPMETPAR